MMTTATDEQPTQALRLHEPYTDIKAELAKLAEENEKAVFDYEDPKGNKMARSHIYKFRQIKSDIERRRKELKADVLERGRMIDGVAKELTTQVVAMIEVHEEPIKRIESREAERKRAIQEAMDAIRAPGEAIMENTADEHAKAIKLTEAIEIDADTYQERMAEAVKLKDEQLHALKADHARLVAAEKERAELDRLRKAEAAREQAEREERIRAEAEAKAKREAEEAAAQAKSDAEARERELKEQAERAEREKAEAAKRAEAERQAAIEQAERDKQQAVEDERRRQREAEEAREREAAKAKAEEEKRAANKRHRAKVILEAAKAIDLLLQSEHDADQIVEAIVNGDIPHVTINF